MAALGVTALLGWLVSSLQPGDDNEPATTSSEAPSVSGTLGGVPDDEVNRIHAALHDIGARCGPAAADPATLQQLAADVEVIVSFAQRYPDALFTIDDETGRSLSLLLVARDETAICAPVASQRADSALPAQFRAPISQPGTPPP